LAQAPGVDRDDVVDAGRFERVQLGVEDAAAVAGPQQRVSARRAAARVVTRYRGDQRPRLAMHPEAVAQMAGVLDGHPRPPAVDTYLTRRHRLGQHEVLAQLPDPLRAGARGEVRDTATGRGPDHPGELLAE